MKKNIFYIIIIFSLSTTLYSCGPGPDNDDPQPIGDAREKFVEQWTCSEQSKLNGASSFTVTISLNSSNSTQIYLTNFYQLGGSQKVYGIVTDNSVTLANQTVNGILVKSGNGTITSNNNQINWNYRMDDGADIDTCTAVFTK